MSTTNILPATLTTTTSRGASYPAHAVLVDDYIWHQGVYRRVTAIDGFTIRMGRFSTSTLGPVEVLEWWK